MVNIGDILYQLFALAIIFVIICSVFFVIRSQINKSNKSNRIEQKLDRIIELLEKDRKE